MKFRFFFGEPIYDTWSKLFVLSEDGKLYSEYLDNMNPATFEKRVDFTTFQAEDFKWRGYQTIKEIDQLSAKQKILKYQSNWIDKYLESFFEEHIDENYSRNEVPSDDFRVSIPDVNFQRYLSEELGINVTNETVAYGDVKEVTAIDCSLEASISTGIWEKGKSENLIIYSLDGLNYFKNLQFLSLAGHKINSLDISQNTFLTKLDCASNLLTEIDISQNNRLTYLRCSFNRLSRLDVTNNTSLTDLDIRDNKILGINLSKNESLTYLDCSFNIITDLYLYQNKKIKFLFCDYNQLKNIDLSQNNFLIEFNCSYNKLTNLILPKCNDLYSIRCYHNHLIKIDVNNCVGLEELYCNDNQLTNLDLSMTTNLGELNCRDNKIKELDVSQNKELSSISTLYVDKNTNVKGYFGLDNFEEY